MRQRTAYHRDYQRQRRARLAAAKPEPPAGQANAHVVVWIGTLDAMAQLLFRSWVRNQGLRWWRPDWREM